MLNKNKICIEYEMKYFTKAKADTSVSYEELAECAKRFFADYEDANFRTLKMQSLVVILCHLLPKTFPDAQGAHRLTVYIGICLWTAVIDDFFDDYNDLLDLSEIYDKKNENNGNDGTERTVCYRLYERLWREVNLVLSDEHVQVFRLKVDQYIDQVRRGQKKNYTLDNYWQEREHDFAYWLLVHFPLIFMHDVRVEMTMLNTPELQALSQYLFKFNILFNDIASYEKEVLENNAVMNYVRILMTSHPNKYRSAQETVDAIVAELYEYEEKMYTLVEQLRPVYPGLDVYWDAVGYLVRGVPAFYLNSDRYKVIVLKDVIGRRYVLPALKKISLAVIGVFAVYMIFYGLYGFE